ncbi:hypothetical protein REPUB_Repub13aG0056100 [Reevesia pubescens]
MDSTYAHALPSGHTSIVTPPTAHVFVSASTPIGRCLTDEEEIFYGMTGGGSRSPFLKVKSCANIVVRKRAATAKNLGMSKTRPFNKRLKEHGVNPNSQTRIKIIELVNAKRKVDDNLVAAQKSQRGGSKATKGKQKMWRICSYWEDLKLLCISFVFWKC